jgi:outer membrane protein TolC
MTCALFATLCLLPCASAQGSSGGLLTLDEALQLAKSNNRDLKQFRLEVGKQREAFGEAKTHLYPRFDTSVLAAQLLAPLDFTINKGQFGTFPGTGPIPGSNTDLHTPARPIAIASVTATQPLTQLIRIHLSIADHTLKVDAAQLSFRQREQKLTDDVRQSYYQFSVANQYESQQSVVKYLEELLQLTDRRFNQQAALESRQIKCQGRTSQGKYQLTTIEDTLADSKDPQSPLGSQRADGVPREPVPATFPTRGLSAARAIALEHRPEVKLAANRTVRLSWATKSEKSHYIPDIAIQAATSVQQISIFCQNIGSVGRVAHWQPWDWGREAPQGSTSRPCREAGGTLRRGHTRTDSY